MLLFNTFDVGSYQGVLVQLQGDVGRCAVTHILDYVGCMYDFKWHVLALAQAPHCLMSYVLMECTACLQNPALLATPLLLSSAIIKLTKLVALVTTYALL